MSLNLQAVEGALCEYRKLVTEQPGTAILCGKARPRSGMHYVPRRTSAQDEYKRWLQTVHGVVLKHWFDDRTPTKL